MLHSLKDSVAAGTARRYANQLVARYGTIEKLTLDSRQRRMEIIALLHGETVPVTLVVDRYTVERDANGAQVRIESCQCSRPWLQALLEDYARGKPFKIPAWAAAVI